MTAAVGWTGIILALFSSMVLAVQAFRAQRHPDGPVRREHLRLAVAGMMVGAVVAMAALEFALLTDDFSVSYVAENSATTTPLLFKVSTAWSALSGSIVLWALILAGYTLVVLRQVHSTEDRLGTGALAVMGLVATFFFGMVATVANPFGIIANPPLDGPGPNPLLQNHLMILIHPPMLYLGFVGFTVAFAFAISALIIKESGVAWLRRSRRANLVAWSFLSAGLLYGAWWSYEVLGWGGYWAWDPVENAALIPWLVATAFIHSSVVQIKRGMLQAWNFALVLLTFSLTILGTFLTRSSVVSSVHSFSQSGIGPALLGFFVLVLAGGFTLLALRSEQTASRRRPESLLSREGAFLVNNVLLTVFAFVVLLGTLYPVLVEVATGTRVSVGRPFFDRLAVPLSVGLLLAMGAGPFTPYRRADPAVMWRRLRTPLLGASIVAAALVLSGLRSLPVVSVGFIVVAMIVASVQELVTTAPTLHPRPILRLLRTHRGYWGGQVSHLGLATLALGIAVTSSLADRSTLTLERGEPTEVLGYNLTYQGIHPEEQPGRDARVARIVFRHDGRVVHVAEPALTTFTSQVQAVGTPSVWSTPGRDVYVSLSSLEAQRIGVNVYRYPFMWLVWAGGTLVALGGLWALGGRRRRRPHELPPRPAPNHRAVAGTNA
jgi:cytochrome c-type biogenesis protein CcmF